MRCLVPPFPRPGPGAFQQPVPRCHQYYGFVRLLSILRAFPTVSLGWRYLPPPLVVQEMRGLSQVPGESL